MTPEKIVEQERIFYTEAIKEKYYGKATLNFMPAVEAHEKGLLRGEANKADADLFFFGLNLKSRNEQIEISFLIKRGNIEHNYIFKVFCRMEKALGDAVLEYFCNE